MQRQLHPIIDPSSIPREVISIMEVLHNNGFESFAVGGGTRDSILGIPPKDWDIATNAKPDQTKSLFQRTKDTGSRYGTISIFINNKKFEVTTYRIDGEYEKLRRPKTVYFTDSIVLDLERRDFTINAIAYNHYCGLFDPFGGVDDINLKIIRTVGNPNQRFREDAIRMLRAIRLSIQLDFRIENDTFNSIANCSHLIQYVGKERIRDELSKILDYINKNNSEKFILLYQSNLMKYIIPELDKSRVLLEIKSIANLKLNTILRWTMLLSRIIYDPTNTSLQSANITNNEIKKVIQPVCIVLDRLKVSNKIKSKILTLLKYMYVEISPNFTHIRSLMSIMGSESFKDLLDIKLSRLHTQFAESQIVEQEVDKLNKIIYMHSVILDNKDCISLDCLAVNGNDLIELGIKSDIQLGIILDDLLNYVIKYPELNTRDSLLTLAKKLTPNTI